MGGPLTIMSERNIKVSNGEIASRPRRRASLGAVMAVIAICGAGFLLGRYIPSRRISPVDACVENLRVLNAATIEWAAAKHKTPSDNPDWESLCPYLVHYNKSHYACPAGGVYSLGGVDKPPTCSHPGHALK